MTSISSVYKLIFKWFKQCSGKKLNFFEKYRNCYCITTPTVTAISVYRFLNGLHILLGVPQKGELEGNLMAISFVESSIQELEEFGGTRWKEQIQGCYWCVPNLLRSETDWLLNSLDCGRLSIDIQRNTCTLILEPVNVVCWRVCKYD